MDRRVWGSTVVGLLGLSIAGLSLLFHEAKRGPHPKHLRSPFIPEPGHIYQVRARALRDAETWMNDVTSEEMVRYRRARREEDPSGLRKPITIAFLRDGRMELIDGRHRLALADDDDVIPVEIKPSSAALYERTVDTSRGPSGIEYEKGAEPTPLMLKHGVVDVPSSWKPLARKKPFPYEEWLYQAGFKDKDTGQWSSKYEGFLQEHENSPSRAYRALHNKWLAYKETF